jgi:outer membrane protein
MNLPDRNTMKYHSRFIAVHLFSCLCLALGAAHAETEEFKPELAGDMGLGGYYARNIIRGNSNVINVLPYLDLEYGQMFARVDTLGIKTLKLGYGHLELVGRISQDGFSTNAPNLSGLGKRETSLPVGVGRRHDQRIPRCKSLTRRFSGSDLWRAS